MVSDDRLAPRGLAGVDVVVETAAPEAGPLADLLASEGARVRLATPAELDGEPRAGAAFLDSWTPEVAPRVVGLREQGALVTCLADLVLARAGPRTIAVTGTAGKTTTTSLTAQLLRAAGIDVSLPEPGLSGNLWPDASLIGALGRSPRIVVEVTSSHLAFCNHSPQIAVVTSFWPDHIELHGSLEAYRQAKEAIVRRQSPGGWLVVPADGTCDGFVSVARARVARFSLTGPVEQGAFVRRGRVVVRWESEEHDIVHVDSLPLRGSCVANALAACAAALAGGAPPGALGEGLQDVGMPPHRFVEVARSGGVPVYDDSMAGTPAKASAALELFSDESIVLVAGGETGSTAGPVHATPEERELLEAACALARRKARRTIVFGSAASRLAELLPGAELADGFDTAVELAMAGAQGFEAVLIAPMFPVAPDDRTRVAALARRG